MSPIVAIECPNCGALSQIGKNDLEILKTFLKHNAIAAADMGCPHCFHEIHVYFDKDHMKILLDSDKE